MKCFVVRLCLGMALITCTGHTYTAPTAQRQIDQLCKRLGSAGEHARRALRGAQVPALAQELEDLRCDVEKIPHSNTVASATQQFVKTADHVYSLQEVIERLRTPGNSAQQVPLARDEASDVSPERAPEQPKIEIPQQQATWWVPRFKKAFYWGLGIAAIVVALVCKTYCGAKKQKQAKCVAG